jgi:hypothetical protein
MHLANARTNTQPGHLSAGAGRQEHPYAYKIETGSDGYLKFDGLGSLETTWL